MEVLVIQILTFATVMLFVTGVTALIRGETIERTDNVPAVFRVFSNEIEMIGRLIGPVVDRGAPAQVIQMKKDLIAAALAPLEVSDIRGLQGLASIGLGTMTGVITFVMSMNWSYGVIVFFFFALLGWVYPVTWLAGCARRRKDKMSKALPYAIDLVTVAMQAGQDFGASVPSCR